MEDVGNAIDRMFATGRYKDIQVEAQPAEGGVIVRFVTTEQWFVGHVGAEGKIKSPPDRGTVISSAQLDLGKPFTDDSLAAAKTNLKRIFERNGLYEAKVQPDLRRDPKAQQIHITFVVNAGKRARYGKPVISGNPKLPEKTIVKATGWNRWIIGGGKEMSQERTRRGITGILKKYQKDDRLMATVQIDSMKYDPETRKVEPNLKIEGGPKVKLEAVETKVSSGKLKKYVPIYEERHADRDLLVEGARNLRDYFQTQGYYEVNVDFREKQKSADETVIEYVISRGQRYKIVEVLIQGNRYFDTDTIRERMFLEPATLLRRHGRYSEAFRKKDEENIANLYRSNGFRDIKVVSTLERDYKGKTGQIAVNFRIEEGPQWFIDRLELNGVAQLEREVILARLASSEGQPFSETEIAADRSTVLTYYYTNGFADADFQYSFEPSGQPQRVTLVYNITEGTRQWVRDVLISGLRTTKPRLVKQSLTLKPDDPLSPLALTAGQQRLYDLGVFARVNTAVQNREGLTDRKYALYDLEEANRYRLSLGFGAELARIGGTTASVDQAVGGTGFSPRASMEVSRMNFLGLGHVLTLRGVYSRLQKRGSFSYLAPRFRNVEGRNVTFTTLYDNSREVRTFQSKRQEASVQVAQQLSKPTTALLRFAYRRVSATNVVIPTLLVPALLQPVRIGILSANLVQDRRDDPAETRRGIFNTMDFGVATRYFGSQRSFIRGLGRNATYHRLTRNVVLARELTIGIIRPFSVPAGVEPENSIPLPERFFGGGSTSHRGFPENQAGPRDIGESAGAGAPATEPTGFPLGGNALLFHMTELRFPLLGENIRGVLFHDAGNVYRGIGDISFRYKQRDDRDFNYMVHATGVGLRYKTPVGPIRVDLAYSMNPPRFVGFKGTTADLLNCNPGAPPAGVCVGVPQRISRFQFFFSIGQTF